MDRAIPSMRPDRRGGRVDPAGRVAEPAEIAEWVWILAGLGAGDYMTGETVSLAGGFLLR